MRLSQSSSKEVTLKFSPRVVINSPSYISLCPPNVTRNVTVYCSATSSSQKIKLHLFVDNDKVIPQKPPTMKDGKLYITMQEYTLEVDRHFGNRSLRCQRGRFSNDTARIDVFVPPASNPLFVLNGGMVINQITVIPGDARLSITCLVNKGTPLVSNISVVCYFVNGTRFLDKHNSSSLVIFTIYGKSLSVESNCICTAQHISGCYDEKASLKISINGTKENHVQSEDTTDYKSIIYITVIVLLLIIIIAMSVFILRHRKAFYYYYLYKKYYVRIPEGCDRFGSAIHFYKYVSSFKVPKPNPPPPRRLAPSCPSDIDTEDLTSSSEVKYFIIWNKENKENQTYGEVSRCYLNSTCFTNSTSRYFVNMTSSYELQFSYTFASTFMILNVTEKDRGAVIYCGVIYEIPSLSEPETVMVCRLPVFDFTLPPSCHALLYMPDVSIVCDFQRVHPKVKCEFGYEANVFQPEVPVEYTVKTLAPTLPDYYNITCKGLLKFKDSYRTIYYVKFSPIYELYIGEDGIKDHGRVQEVTLKLFPRVVINSPAYISICPPNLTNTMTVYCSATSSSPSVSLNLFVDNIQVMPQKPPRQLLSELYITMQEYTLQVDQNFQNKTLQCQREGFYNDSATVGIVIPPTSDPLFVLDGGMVIKHINVIPENSKISMKCLVNDGFPFVSNITVVCYFLNGTWHLKIHNASNFVFFTIYGKYLPLESYCICSAHHLSGCYTKNALLRISVNDANERVARSEDELYYEFIIYVAAALVIIILVSINIAMSVFFVRHRKSPNHHQNPYAKSTKLYDRVSKSTESQTYESPSETSMLSGSSLSVSTSDFVETLNNNHNPNQNMRFVNLKMASLEGINPPELPPRTKLCSDYEGNYITENSENAYQDTLKQSSEQRLTERQQIDDGKRLCSHKESTIGLKESVSTNSRAEKDFDNEHCIFYSQNYENCEIPTKSFCYFDTPATETPKPQNKLGHGSGGKIYLEDPESNFSNEYSSTSEIKRIRQSNRLRTDKKRSGKKNEASILRLLLKRCYRKL
uniref:Uncharacterized protein n=1 Tax=Biomphalaria glabrata TaxID=6526 RepID=A0A2C9LR90_BIOGL